MMVIYSKEQDCRICQQQFCGTNHVHGVHLEAGTLNRIIGRFCLHSGRRREHQPNCTIMQYTIQNVKATPNQCQNFLKFSAQSAMVK